MPPKSQSSTQKVAREAPREVIDTRPRTALQQRLDGIEQLCKRVSEHAEFMREVEGLASSSSEAKEAAVAAFHERLTTLERQLGKIAEGLRLG